MSEEVTLEEAKALIQKQTQRKPSKYRNKKTAYNGRVYDSAREANHAMELDVQLKAGVIAGWTPQVDFPLLVDGVTVGKYRADFVVRYESSCVNKHGKKPIPDREVVHEVKGYETAMWKLKRRILLANHPRLELLVIR